MCFAIYKVWEQKCKCILLFTECGSENANVFCHLQSVGAKMQLYFAIYKVWEQKCNCILLFTKSGSQNQKLISLHIPNCYRNQYDSSDYYLYITCLI